MTTIQLNPPIEVHIAEKGYGWALLHIDYGPGMNGVFLIALESGEFLYNEVVACQPAENFAFNFRVKPE